MCSRWRRTAGSRVPARPCRARGKSNSLTPREGGTRRRRTLWVTDGSTRWNDARRGDANPHCLYGRCCRGGRGRVPAVLPVSVRDSGLWGDMANRPPHRRGASLTVRPKTRRVSAVVSKVFLPRIVSHVDGARLESGCLEFPIRDNVDSLCHFTINASAQITLLAPMKLVLEVMCYPRLAHSIEKRVRIIRQQHADDEIGLAHIFPTLNPTTPGFVDVDVRGTQCP